MVVQKPIVIIKHKSIDTLAYYEKGVFYDKNNFIITDFEGAYVPVEGKLTLLSGEELDKYMYGYDVISS